VASVEFLGVAFDADGTYSNFAESNGSVVEPEPPQEPEEPEQPEQPTGELALGDIVAPAPATVSKNAAGEQTVTYSASAGWSTYDIAVTNYDAKYIYFVAEFTPSADTAICFAINGEIDWAIGHKVYVGGEKATETFMVSEYNLPANFTVSMYIDASVEVTAEKSVVFHSIAFKAPESNEMAFGDIVAPAPATATKNAEGEQVVTYSASAGWDTYTVAVTNYDSKNTVFEAVFTASAEVTICFEINGKIDWSLGHKLYPAGSENKQLIDVSTYELPKNFTIGMYIDAEAEVTAEKSIVFHSIAFTEPEPEPEGMYFVEPIASAMQCVANANGGYDLTWTHNGVDYSAVNVGVKNFDVTYDILVVRMNASAGQSIGIYLTYMKEVDGEVVPVDMAVRTHWSTESVITKDGEQEFVFFMERFGIKGAVISAVKLYFDAPTGAYTPLEGEQTATLNEIIFVKASEQSFGELNITAPAVEKDYNGEAVVVEASASADVELLVEYEIIDAEGKASWTTSAPSQAGVYNVKVTFVGSLAYAYQTVTSTLTINKVQAVLAEGDLTFDAETRVVTVAEGVIAYTNADFVEGFEVLDGAVVGYGTVIYYKRAADENHEESEVASLTCNRPTQPEPEPEPEPGPGEEPEPSVNCGATAGVASAFAALIGIGYVFSRKRK
ncbi:MAG: hypothetical protein IJF71_07890, partial [Clostridia bacterium]|nr:hypothetical protein [Clostridia bacterium]